MTTIILKDIVSNSSSNDQGDVLFNSLKNAYLSSNPIILQVDSDMTMSSSFLNSSIGIFLDEYGILSFKKTVKFKGSKSQFSKLSNYIAKYESIYLV